MANKTTFFPPVNGFRMTPKDKVLPTRYNYWAFDAASLKIQSKQRGQIDSHYAQKVQYSDQQQLLFYTPVTATATVKVYNDKGEEIATIADPLTTSYVYLCKDANGNIEPLLLHYRYWKFNSGTYDAGYYFLVVETTYDDDTKESFISEPLLIRTKHPKTVLLRWLNDVDDFDVLWEQIRPRFGVRFESDYLRFEPASDDVVMDDQDNNVVPLYDNPYRVFSLNYGGNRGVPDWLIDKINRGMCCSTFDIDGVRYRKDNGAKMEIAQNYNYGLQSGTIKLREYYNDAAGKFTNSTPVDLIPIAGYPFTSDGWEMFDLVTGRIIFDVPHEYAGAGDITNYLSYFNDVVAVQHELGGEYVNQSGVIKYLNGEGENFTLTRATTIRTTYLEGTVNIASTAIPWQYQYGGKGAHILVYDADTNRDCELITEAGHNSFNNPILQTQLVGYSSTGNKKVRIYTDNKMTALQFDHPGSNKVTAINNSTNVSNTLERFMLRQQAINGVFNQGFLRNAKDTLKLKYLDRNGITEFTTGWGQDLVSGSYKPFPLCKYYDFSGNALSQTSVDETINEFYDYTNHGYSGVFRIHNQNPPAAPTVVSATARTQMTTTYIWTLNTD